ncbi:hypothetical protein [Mycolicibacterium celeriflavum]|uniref:hypothetical protein n=1 Tax=Mycolicibacterium celeriflavum TaxID=1249101 RepID=UPI001A98A271|nr:hypothetical protein [Mycolicibacterium celeriflavum]
MHVWRKFLGGLIARAVSLRDVLAFIVRHEWLFAVSVTGAILGLLPLLPLPRLQVVQVGIGVLGLGVTLVLLVRDVRAVFDKHSPWEFGDALPLFPPEITVRDPGLPLTVRMARGTMSTSAHVNRAIADWNPAIDWRTDEFRLEGLLQERAPAMVFRTTRGKYRYNSLCVRMESDLDEHTVGEPLPVVLRPARYFDGLCSNMLTPWNISHHGVPWHFREEYLLTPSTAGESVVVPLSVSALANLLGVSTLAMTTDDFLVLPLQSEASSSSARLLAPSGSGSLEPRDLSDSAASTLLRGVERELREECGLTRSDIAGSRLIGFGRWLEHGGKPEFIALTALTIEAGAIRRKPKWAELSEAVWTQSVAVVPLCESSRIADPYTEPGSVTAMVTGDYSLYGSASVPLEFAVRCLIDTLQQRPSTVSELRSLVRKIE